MRPLIAAVVKKEKQNDWFLATICFYGLSKPAVKVKRKANLKNNLKTTKASLQEARATRQNTHRLVHKT